MGYKESSDCLVVVGGTDFGECFNDVYTFDLGRGEKGWKKVRDGRKRIGGIMGMVGGEYDCFVGRFNFWACELGDEVLLVGGGEDLDDGVYDDVWRSEDWGRKWEKLGSVRGKKGGKGGLVGASACVLGGVVFIFGGKAGSFRNYGGGPREFFNCYWCSKDGGFTWSKVMATEREFTRASLTATAVERRNEIVVIGGKDGDDAVGESKGDDRRIIDTYVVV
ncbi:hypothetical protein TrLO_g14132 [Triparma laevis f. longispina]|uniref:Galactose oxidase n=1 Tax=Triparma laevis f. longispina TaxID=1714387 RepID=A0A9W7F3N2_9STRA|nr:hypothetical protein TrLO_g14132 [Triparma laevis f. longispina]